MPVTDISVHNLFNPGKFCKEKSGYTIKHSRATEKNYAEQP